MAQNIVDGANRKHNAQARKEQLHNAFKVCYEDDLAIAKAIETHVKPYRDNKKGTKKRLKDDLDIPPKVFDLEYRRYKAQREAEEQGDDETLDLIREAFEASPYGVQVDMIEVAAGQPDGVDDGVPPEGDGGSATAPAVATLEADGEEVLTWR